LIAFFVPFSFSVAVFFADDSVRGAGVGVAVVSLLILARRLS